MHFLTVVYVLLFSVGASVSLKNDPYAERCRGQGLVCHESAVCVRDQVFPAGMEQSYYCRCLPGWEGDGINNCVAPAIFLSVAHPSRCDETGAQSCFITKLPGQEVQFQVKSLGVPNVPVQWFKYYVGEPPNFKSYRKLLTPPKKEEAEDRPIPEGGTLTIPHIEEDDFYETLYWAEVLPAEQSTVGTRPVVAFDLAEEERLNPSPTRVYFGLETKPIVAGKFLPGDSMVIRLQDHILKPHKLHKVRWKKEGELKPFIRQDEHLLETTGPTLTLNHIKDSDFGVYRAELFGRKEGIPGMELIATRRFNVTKDISKTCNGTRSRGHCKCNPGFLGNGEHCADIDECSAELAHCLPEASCRNTEGSYRCECPTGYRGDGRTRCEDVDECAKEDDVTSCHDDAECVNTLGSYLCECKTGYMGDGTDCLAISAWTPWSPWSQCTETCGHPANTRVRVCTHPESGMRCDGPSVEQGTCKGLPPCPVDGGWTVWSPWAPCTALCGGTKQRARTCDNPVPAHGGRYCQGDVYQREQCQPGPACAVDGGWTPWATWSACSVTCSVGRRLRTRSCTNPTPRYGGRYCAGGDAQQEKCGEHNPECYAVDAVWGEWSEWSECSHTCGLGSRFRRRLCRRHLGPTCSGENTEQQPCMVEACPAEVENFGQHMGHQHRWQEGTQARRHP
ncbi:HMCN1 [Branchiostoma lanceolatum]|uniref:HMCN1 protein n=1 Tax=Branchiostoma lanceolatum TaxID=7740 RepID=A0A8J9VKV4_BRALA|nr:HMCN1 [Branchiostoma lanceolatum]